MQQGECNLTIAPRRSTAELSIHCGTHDCRQETAYSSSSEALDQFACDGGRDLRFLLLYSDSDVPSLVDLSLLHSVLRSSIADEHLGVADRAVEAYRWVGGTEFRRVTAELVPGTGGWHTPETMMRPTIAYPEYQLVDADGVDCGRITVRLNGDA